MKAIGTALGLIRDLGTLVFNVYWSVSDIRCVPWVRHAYVQTVHFMMLGSSLANDRHDILATTLWSSADPYCRILLIGAIECRERTILCSNC